MASFFDLTNSAAQTNPYLDTLIADRVFKRGVQISYAFLNTERVPAGTDGGRTWTSSGATAAFEGALGEWAAVANLNFRRWPFTYTGGSRDGITWVEKLERLGSGNSLLGQHSYPADPTQEGSYNIDHPYWSTDNNRRGGFSYLTFLHEIGHAIGLEHPHEDNPFPGVTGQNDTGDNGLNTALYTVMSYNEQLPDGSQSYSRAFGWQMTPGAFDIAAVQALYGANMSTGAGDNVYRLPDNNVTGTGFAAIWDAGGTDWISAEGIAGRTFINLNAATLQNAPGGGGWLSQAAGIYGGFTIANGVTIENARGGSGADYIIGNAAANRIEGGGGDDDLFGDDGNDTLEGGDGNDTLDGAAGSNTLAGGGGNDTYRVAAEGNVIFEAAGGGDDIVYAKSNFYLWDGVETLVLMNDDAGGAKDLFGVGNGLDNRISGNYGNNLLIGGGGNDEINASLGNDALFGEAGDDRLHGGVDIDYLVGGDGNDTLDGDASADAIYGEAGDDMLIGGSDDFSTDILVGGVGRDTLDGASGRGDYDLMDGGADDDLYRVDTPADLTFEAAGGGTDTVIATISGAGYYLYPHVENLELQGSTPFGVGNDLANRLTAGSGTQWLLGGAGDDTIDGGAGNDVLFGESGADVFLFRKIVPDDPFAGASIIETVTSGADVIGDFQPGSDRIQLSGYGFTSFESLRAGFVEVNGTTAINFGDGNFVVLNGVANAALSAGDFIFG